MVYVLTYINMFIGLGNAFTRKYINDNYLEPGVKITQKVDQYPCSM